MTICHIIFQFGGYNNPFLIWALELWEYSETLGIGLGLNPFYGLGLGLEAETQIISVSDSVSIL